LPVALVVSTTHVTPPMLLTDATTVAFAPAEMKTVAPAATGFAVTSASVAPAPESAAVPTLRWSSVIPATACLPPLAG
jgi:hypothetical protein